MIGFAFALVLLCVPVEQQVVCLGDSITEGRSLGEEMAWPTLLQQRLGDGSRVHNLGVGGATLLRGTDRPYLSTSVWRNRRRYQADVAVVILGTNDTVLNAHRKCWDQVDHLDDDLDALFDAIGTRFGEPRILICSPPSMFPDKSGLSPERAADLQVRAPRLAQLAAHYRLAAAARPGVDFVDLSRVLTANQVTDGVHLTPFGSAAIADRLAEVLRTKLDPDFPNPLTALAKAEIEVHQSDFHGFARLNFSLATGENCVLVRPHFVAKDRPWIWRARFFGHQPELDLALLDRGFHLVYCDVANLYGAPSAVKRWQRAYDFLRQQLGLGEKLILEGLSRGGLPVLNFALHQPNQVAAIVLDNGVCDFRSWPGGRSGKRSDADWAGVLQSYQMKEKQAWKDGLSPLDRLQALADAKIPIHALLGTADEVVPPAENGLKLAQRYRELDGAVTLWLKPGKGHHPHGLNPVAPLVRSLLRDLGVDDFNPATAPLPSVEYRGQAAGWGGGTWLNQVEKMRAMATQNPDLEIVFFGDSITQGLTGANNRITHPRVLNPGESVARVQGKRPIDRFNNAISLGLSGDRTEHLIYRTTHGALEILDPKLIVLAIGVNNINAHHTGPETAAGLQAVVEQLLKSEPQATILICGPFPCGKNPDDPRRAAINDVHRAADQLAAHKRVQYQDLRPLFLDQTGHLNNFMRSDSIHINRAGQIAWMEAIAPTIGQLLLD
jgi:lysophospholipase L1-like esterase/pimeloyl-ACP methyl ester carboxylesterase